MKIGDLVQLKDNARKWFLQDYGNITMLITDIYVPDPGESMHERTMAMVFSEPGMRTFDLKDLKKIGQKKWES